MKLKTTLFLLLTFIISTPAYSATSDKCPGQEGFYFTNYKIRNPSMGGFVSFDAVVDESNEGVYIGKNAAVCDYASVEGAVKIAGKTVLNDYATVSGQNIEINGNIALEGDVSIGSNTKIRGNGTLKTGSYSDQTLFLKDTANEDALRIKNLFKVKEKMYYQKSINNKPEWAVTQILKFEEVANARKKGCVFNIEVEAYTDSRCDNNGFESYEKYIFTLDIGRDIAEVGITGFGTGSSRLNIDIKKSRFNPSFRLVRDPDNFTCGNPVTLPHNKAHFYYVEFSGVPLMSGTEGATSGIYALRTKLKQAIKQCE